MKCRRFPISMLYFMMTALCWSLLFTAEISGIEAEPRLKGVFLIEGEDGKLENPQFYNSNPAVGADGVIYAASSAKRFFAINPDGGIKWTVNDIWGNNPAIGHDGTVYTCHDSCLISISNEGMIQWKHHLDSNPWGAMAVTGDGAVIVASQKGTLYAVNPDGSLRWKYHFNDAIFGAPAIGPDGTIYLACNDQTLYALNAWGTTKWKYNALSNISSGTLAIGAGGTVYFTSDYRLHALGPDGALLWITEPDYYGNPVIGSDGTIYIGGRNSSAMMHALNKDGSIKWKSQENGYSLNTVLGSGGVVYTMCDWNRLGAFDASDGNLVWSFQFSENGNQPVIAPDGTLYICADYFLYAFQTDSYGYEAGAPWPNFLANNTRCITDPDHESPPLYTVSGAIVLPDSTPLAGVQVSIDSLITVTGEDGYFSFELPDGEYALDIATGMETIPRRIYTAVQGEDVNVDIDQTEWHTVSGRMMMHGQPLAGVTVHAGEISTTSGSDGRFSLYLSEGNHTLEFDRENHGYFPSLKDVTVHGMDRELEDIGLYPIRMVYNGTYTLREGFFWSGEAPCIMEAQGGSTIIKRFEENGFVYVCKFAESLDRFPATGAEGFLFRSRDNLTLLNPDFTYAWEYPISANTSVIGNGIICYGIQGNLVALNYDGSFRWKSELLTDGALNVTCAPDGTLYVIASPGMLHACNPADGSINWTFSVQNESLTYLFLSPDDRILVKASRYYYLLNPDGSLRWKYYLGGSTWFPPAFGPDGMVLINTDDGELIAISVDGEVIWTYTAHPEFQNPVYNTATDEFWCRNEYTYGLDPTDGSIKWKDPIVFLIAASSPGGDMYIHQRISYEERKLYHIDINPDPPVSVDDPEAGEQDNTRQHPASIVLLPNYPNPFNPSTTIAFTLPETGDVRLAIFNINGQLVREIVTGQIQAGRHEFVWDGRNEDGAQAGSGIYLARLKVGGKITVQRMALIR